MKKFEFEFDDNKLKLKLLLISFFLFLLLLVGISYLNKLNFILTIIISFVIPYLIFKSFEKNIKKDGLAEITSEKLKFKLKEIETEIYFNEIEKYFINSHNGTSLSLKLKNRKKIEIVSNIFFCNPLHFSEFCKEFEKEIIKYNNNKNFTIEREKSFFEKTWVYPSLIIFTFIIIIIAGVAIYKGKHFNAPFFGSIGSLLTLWSGYFSGKRKAK